MFTTLVSLALVSSLAIRGAVADFTISSPSLVACQEAHITWNGGKAPYNLIVVPNDAPCDDVLVDLGSYQVNSITWKANITAGTKVLLSLEDVTGDEAWSNTITVGKSNDTSCLLAAGASSASVSASPSVSASEADAAPTPGTTLSIPDDSASTPAVANAGAAPSASDAAVPIGAAGKGVIGQLTSGAIIDKLSGSLLAVTAAAAAFIAAF